MRAFDKLYLLELYSIHSDLARAIVRAGVALRHGGDLHGALAEADDLAWVLEEKFAETLTPQERGIAKGKPDDREGNPGAP